MNRIIVCVVVAASCSVTSAATFNLQSDWSNVSNPNGPWSLNEGNNPLPFVPSWQAGLGGWAAAQPAWARSQDSNNRIPMFFMSNGSETFTHDWVAGQVVCHTWDGANGSGNGQGNVAFTVQTTGLLTISGGVWLGRDIGRAVNWFISVNGVDVTGGSLASGDVYSSANPFDFADGSGGASAVTNIAVAAGDIVRLRLTNASNFGDFAVIDLTIENVVPAPGAALALLGGAGMAVRRRRR